MTEPQPNLAFAWTQAGPYRVLHRTVTGGDGGWDYLTVDGAGHRVFISSRKEVNGPTMGDKGGASRIDGNGFYAQLLRSAKRL